jgi:hypothetical protein
MSIIFKALRLMSIISIAILLQSTPAFALVDGAGHDLIPYNVGIGTTGAHAALEVKNTAGFTSQYDNGNSGAAKTIDWTNGNKQKVTLTANCTFTFTDPGVVGNLILEIVQDATGGRTVTWPAAVKWPGGNAPSLTGSANAVDMTSFFYNKTSYYGNASLDYQ